MWVFFRIEKLKNLILQQDLFFVRVASPFFIRLRLEQSFDPKLWMNIVVLMSTDWRNFDLNWRLFLNFAARN